MPLPLLMLSVPFAMQRPCPHAEAAPDIASARRIAEQRIAALPPRPLRYLLRIVPHRSGGPRWLAYESPEGPANTRGGGGGAMVIDRCTGEVSGFHHQR